MLNPAKLGFSWQRQPQEEPPEEPQIFEEIVLSVEDVLKLFSSMKISLVDMSILKKFYMTGKPSPFDTSGWCFSILFNEMKKQLDLETGYNNFYHKVVKFERNGLIKRAAPSCNPVVFNPIERIKYVIRKAMIVWLAKRGLKML